MLWELRAKVERAGYETGWAADLENKPTADAVAEKVRLTAKELGIGAEHRDVCIERFKVGFGWGLHDAETVKIDQRETEVVGE